MDLTSTIGESRRSLVYSVCREPKTGRWAEMSSKTVYDSKATLGIEASSVLATIFLDPVYKKKNGELL